MTKGSIAGLPAPRYAIGVFQKTGAMLVWNMRAELRGDITGENLTNCDEILAFSDDTARLFKKVYPDVYHLRVIPHKPHYLPALNKRAKTTKTWNIGLLGVLCYKKGLDVVKELASYIEKEKLIGTSDEEIDSPVFSFTGRYGREELPRLTMQEDIDIFLIPAIWPETFSYTASEVMSMRMPLAVFPIGAPVERVQHYEKGMILSDTDPETIVKEITEFAVQTLKIEDLYLWERKFLLPPVIVWSISESSSFIRDMPLILFRWKTVVRFVWNPIELWYCTAAVIWKRYLFWFGKRMRQGVGYTMILMI